MICRLLLPFVYLKLVDFFQSTLIQQFRPPVLWNKFSSEKIGVPDWVELLLVRPFEDWLGLLTPHFSYE